MSRSSWRLTLRLISGLLIVALLVQFFIAGIAAMTDPDWWSYHRMWVAIFQWLVVLLPIVALFADRRRYWYVVFASIPLLQTGLQYVLVHRALEGRLPVGIGLHAVNGALMLVVATILTIGALDRAS